RSLVGERRFALGVQLIAGHRDPITIAEGYSDLAEGAIIALTRLAEDEFAHANGRIAQGEFVVLALGRLGGRALTNASDLDLIYLYDAPDGALADGPKKMSAANYYNRLASRVSVALAVPTASGPLYEVDTRLRPQGAQGMLAVSLDTFDSYQRTEAWTWEHMALCRARPLTGSPAARNKVATLVCAIFQIERDPAAVARDSAAMRADMAKHKPSAGALDVKLGDGGLVDLEFAVHTLQLTRHVGLDPRLEVALDALVAADLIDSGADPDLRLLSSVLVILRLVAPDVMDPPQSSRTLVASLAGFPDWQSMVEALAAARHRVAARWAQVKKDGEA
ncbi:MAG: glutamine-synthetase adenylyltransferase, partial [Sphingomicrobium sp.]